MNTSSWKKATDIIAKVTPANLQMQAAATAESQNLQSLPLSALSIDDSGPPQVTCEPQQPIATSTPRATSTESPAISTEAYRQILPGMSAQLYPTLIADSSLDTHIPDNQDTLHTQLTSEVDEYLQEAAERCEMDVNYFNGQHMARNTINHQQKVDSVELEADEIPELIDQDTSKKGKTFDTIPESKILDASNLLILSNLQKPWTIACKDISRVFEIEYSTYHILNRSELCECSLTAGNYLLSYMNINCGNAPETRDDYFTTYYSFNKIVLDIITEKFDIQVDENARNQVALLHDDIPGYDLPTIDFVDTTTDVIKMKTFPY